MTIPLHRCSETFTGYDTVLQVKTEFGSNENFYLIVHKYRDDMKITAFDIARFGLWNNLAMPKLSEGLNIFYGPNEAGKTTLLEFIRALLYGFGGERQRYLLPYRRDIGQGGPPARIGDADSSAAPETVIDGPAGGEMMLHCQNGIFHLRRVYDPKVPDELDSVRLTGIDGQVHGEHLLNLLISGVDEATFNNVFAIGLDELQRLGTLGDTEAADLLFRLSVGLDRVSLVEVMKELTQMRDRLLDPGGTKPSQILRFLGQREKLLEEIAKSRTALREYARINGEKRQLDRYILALETELNEQRREERLYEIAETLLPIRDRREEMHARIESMGEVRAVPEKRIKQLEEIETELRNIDRTAEELKIRRDAVHKEIVALKVDETLRKLTPRIEVLLEDEKRILEIDQQITRFEQEISAIETELAEKESHIKHGRRRAGGKNGKQRPPRVSHSNRQRSFPESNSFTLETSSSSLASGETLPEIPRDGNREQDGAHLESGASLEDFRVPAKALQKAKARYAEIKEEHDDLHSRAKLLGEKIESELAERKVEEFSVAVERTGEMLTQLRRRQAVGSRLAEMLQHRKELDRINAFLVQNQAVPPWMLGVMLLLVAAGCTLAALAYMEKVPIVFFIVGLLGAVGAIAAKQITEKNNSKKLQANQRQLSLLLSQLEQAKQEAAAIDGRFPSDGKPIEQRLQAARDELGLLEKLLPVETQYREIRQRLKTVDSRYEQAKTALSEANRRWRHWLGNVNLPADWSPVQIRDLIGRYDSAGSLRRELDHRYESMNQRIRDMRIITDRIDRIVGESGLVFEEGLSYVDILEQVRNLLHRNDEAVLRRAQFKKELKKVRNEYREALRRRTGTRHRLMLHLQLFDVERPAELRALHQRHVQYLERRSAFEAVCREFAVGLAGFCEEKEIEPLLLPESRGDLPILAARVKAKIEATSEKLRSELETRGRLAEQLKQLTEDREPLRRQRELALLDEKIRQAIRAWRTVATTIFLLDDIRKTYERERQPQTLFEASEILEVLTEGRYRRVWTPLGEETLFVDDAEGNTLEVTWLSRGTREQLFIAIRLALAAAFLKHGTMLPLILDDVLVNFDTQRALAAAKLLQDVAASGRQIFLFTCHEHICRIFQRLDVPVRILPRLSDPEKKIRVLLPLSLLRKRRSARLAARKERHRLGTLRRLEEEQRRRADLEAAILLVQQQATAEKAAEEPFAAPNASSLKETAAPDTPPVPETE